MRMSNISTWESLPAFRLLHRVSLRSFRCTGSVPRAFHRHRWNRNALAVCEAEARRPVSPIYPPLPARQHESSRERKSWHKMRRRSPGYGFYHNVEVGCSEACDWLYRSPNKGAPNSATQACNSVFRATSMKRRWYRISEASSAISCQASCENCPPRDCMRIWYCSSRISDLRRHSSACFRVMDLLIECIPSPAWDFLVSRTCVKGGWV